MSMRKIICVVAIGLFALCVAGCTKIDKSEYSEESMMVRIEVTSDYSIFANKKTKVMYLRTKKGYGEAVCVMLDADGKPQLWEG